MRPRRLTLPDHDLLHVGEVMHHLRLSRLRVLEHVVHGHLRLTPDGMMIHRASVVALEKRLRLEKRGVIRPV